VPDPAFIRSSAKSALERNMPGYFLSSPSATGDIARIAMIASIARTAPRRVYLEQAFQIASTMHDAQHKQFGPFKPVEDQMFFKASRGWLNGDGSAHAGQ